MTGNETLTMTSLDILLRIAIAALIGGAIGYERYIHHKTIGIAGMMLVSIGSCTYMILAKHLSSADPSAISRALQGLLQGIGFLGGAVIFKGGADVRGIKTAAAIWITGAIGMGIGTDLWRLGILVGFCTMVILWVADRSVAREQARQAEQAGSSADEEDRLPPKI